MKFQIGDIVQHVYTGKVIHKVVEPPENPKHNHKFLRFIKNLNSLEKPKRVHVDNLILITKAKNYHNHPNTKIFK